MAPTSKPNSGKNKRSRKPDASIGKVIQKPIKVKEAAPGGEQFQRVVVGLKPRNSIRNQEALDGIVWADLTLAINLALREVGIDDVDITIRNNNGIVEVTLER